MNTAFIKIWGALTGAVAWDEATGIATFEFDPKFKDKGWDLAPLQMSIHESKRDFNFPALRKKADPAPGELLKYSTCPDFPPYEVSTI